MPSRAAAMAPATSPSVMNLIRAPASRISCDQLLVARAVEDADGDVAGRALLGLRDPADVLGDRGGDVDDVGGGRTGGDLLHVEDRRRVEHRAAVGHRHDRDRVGHALGHQRRAVDRVDRDVALGALPVADLLAVVEHRRVVLLALADDDDALHAHRADQRAHRVDRGAVAAVLVAAADPPARGHRGRLGDPHQLEGQVAVRRRPVGPEAAARGARRKRAVWTGQRHGTSWVDHLAVVCRPGDLPCPARGRAERSARARGGGAGELACDPRVMTDGGPTSPQVHDPDGGGGHATAAVRADDAAPAIPAIDRAARFNAANMLRSLLPLVLICLLSSPGRRGGRAGTRACTPSTRRRRCSWPRPGAATRCSRPTVSPRTSW